MSAEANAVEIQQVVEQPIEILQSEPATEEVKTNESKEGAQDDATQEQAKPKNPVQPRIDELTRKAREAEREAQYWRAIAESKKETAAQDATQTKPTPDAFDDYGDYVEALTEWKTQQAVEKRLAERDSISAEQRQAEQQHRTFKEREATVRASIPDYDEVIAANGDLPMSDSVAKLLLKNQSGPEIAYYLAKNPAELDRLNAIQDAGDVGIELGEIKAKMKSQPVKPVTSAPEPITPIGGGRNTAKDPSNMSMDEYVAFRKAQGARWAN